MDLRQLRYFVAVAEELHFGRAAKRLSITQPPLSFNIRQLEASLGMELLRRTTREVALTEAGKVIYREALKLLTLARSAEEQARRAASGEAGVVHIGFVGSSFLTSLASDIRDFAATRPEVEVVLYELSSYEQIDALQRGQIDIGIVHPRVMPSGIASRVLHREAFACLLPETHALARREIIDLQQLQHDDFVLFPRDFSPGYYDKILSLCVEAGFTPHIRHKVRNMLTIATLVSHEFGVSLVPASLGKVQLPNLACRPLSHAANLSDLRGIWRQDEEQPAVLALLSCLAASPG